MLHFYPTELRLTFDDVIGLHLGTKQLITDTGEDVSKVYVDHLIYAHRGKFAERFYTYALVRGGEWPDASPWDHEEKPATPWVNRFLDAWYYTGEHDPNVHLIVWRMQDGNIMEMRGELRETSRRAATLPELLSLPEEALMPAARTLRHALLAVVRAPNAAPSKNAQAVLEATQRNHADLHFAIATIAGKINPQRELGDLQAWARVVRKKLLLVDEQRQALQAATRAFEEDNVVALANGPALVQGLIDAVFRWRNRSTRQADNDGGAG